MFLFINMNSRFATNHRGSTIDSVNPGVSSNVLSQEHEIAFNNAMIKFIWSFNTASSDSEPNRFSNSFRGVVTIIRDDHGDFVIYNVSAKIQLELRNFIQNAIQKQAKESTLWADTMYDLIHAFYDEEIFFESLYEDVGCYLRNVIPFKLDHSAYETRDCNSWFRNSIKLSLYDSMEQFIRRLKELGINSTTIHQQGMKELKEQEWNKMISKTIIKYNIWQFLIKIGVSVGTLIVTTQLFNRN